MLVDPSSTGLPSAARDELTRIRRTGPIALTVLVYEGKGFGATLVRGITTSLNLLVWQPDRVGGAGPDAFVYS